MAFDENPPSPHKMVEPRKPDTKTNLLLSLGLVVFFLIGLALLVYFAVTRER